MIRHALLPVCRWCLRALQTTRSRVGALERVARALLLLSPFGLLLVALRLRLLVAGPLEVEGETIDGVRLRCRLPDLIQMYVYLFGAWEPDLTAFVQRSLGRGDVCIDVGANIGCVTVLAARVVGPAGRVVAIEPSPTVLAALRDGLRRNGCDNVQIVERAASDRHEELALFAGPSHNIGLTATVPHRGLRAQGVVTAAPLADLVPAADLAAARLIKIDVEGAEDRVLAGLVPHLDGLHPDAAIAVELSPIWWSDPTRRPIDVLQPFLDHGYFVYALPNSYWPWRYLWPRAVRAPQRVVEPGLLTRRVPRLDLVLSRRDVTAL